MKLGRPAKPLSEKILSGNPGKRPLNVKARPVGDAEMPKALTKDAKAVWKRTVASMPPGTYAIAHEPLLAAYCEAVVLHRKVTTLIETEGPTVMGSKGQMVSNPNIRTQAEQARLIASLAAALSITPSSNQNLVVTEPTATEDPILALMRH